MTCEAYISQLLDKLCQCRVWTSCFQLSNFSREICDWAMPIKTIESTALQCQASGLSRLYKQPGDTHRPVVAVHLNLAVLSIFGRAFVRTEVHKTLIYLYSFLITEKREKLPYKDTDITVKLCLSLTVGVAEWYKVCHFLILRAKGSLKRYFLSSESGQRSERAGVYIECTASHT